VLAALALTAGLAAAENADKAPVGGAKMSRTHAKVVRKDGKVWIAGVPRPRGTNTVLASLAAVLQSQGESLTYEYLMGVSARAFRLQFNWCPSAPHAYCGYNTYKPAMKAAGWVATDYPMAGFKEGKTTPAAKAKVEKARAAVKASIDAGLPCLFGSEEEAVLVGYGPPAEGTTGWLCRPGPLGGPPAKGEPYLRPVKKYPWGVHVLRKADTPPPPRRESIVASLRTAVANAAAEKLDGYAAGFAAYKRWIAELRDIAPVQKVIQANLAKQKRPSAEKDVRFNLCLGNAWCFESLIDARRCAAAYLRSVAGEFDAPVAEQLRKAADHYDAVVKGLTATCPTEIAPYPWRLKGDRKWTKAMRVKQADLLAAAQAEERRAIERIEKAVHWVEQTPGQVRPAALVGLRLSTVQVPDSAQAWQAHLPTAMVQALRHGGVKTDYAELTAGCGWAFSFSYDYKNWHVAGLPISSFTFLPEQLGFEVVSVRCSDREATWRFIRKHVGAGTPIVCSLGDGGLVYGYRKKGNKRQFWFDGCPVFGWWDLTRTNPMDSCAVLVKKSRARPKKQIIREALARAGYFATPHTVHGRPCGLAAVEAYAADVADRTKSFEGISEWFCWATFERLAARRCCATWLREAAEVLGGPAAKPLRAAANHYDRAAKAYGEYDREVHRTDLEALPWKKRFRTPARIAALLAPLRKGIEAERAAVAQLTRALAAADIPLRTSPTGKPAKNPKGTVRRKGGRVWIEGVPTLGWGRGKETTFCGALEAALAVTEHPVDYATLMGDSALAFRVRWYQGRTGQKWCPSSPVGEVPEPIAAIEKATGWRFRQEWHWNKPRMQRFAADVAASIDAGRPVLTYEPKLNVDVIYGYEDAGKTLLLRDWFHGDKPLVLPAAKLGPMLMFPVRREQPLTRKGALRAALRADVRNWRRKAVKAAKGEYLYGAAALRQWAKDIAGADKLAEKDRQLLFFVSWWNFGCLADARAAAATYLKANAKLMDGDRRKALTAAADLYAREGQSLGGVFAKRDAFLGPWSGKTIQDWSAAVRKREQEVLEQIRKTEAAAIAELSKALAAKAE
jgi:hypothetical protein